MTKDKIIKLLTAQDEYLSGEAMGKRIGVSRAAVSKAVKALKDEGYNIKSKTNMGYRLIKNNDILNKRELLRHVNTDADLIHFIESTDSTNNYAKILGEKGAPHGTLIIAAKQSKGRGRYGRGFASDSEGGVWMSILLRPDMPAADAVLITVLAAVAAVRVLKIKCGLTAHIKWTNDIFGDKRKLCGILTEMTTEAETGCVQQVVLGMGINLNQKKDDFPEGLQDIAASVYMLTKKKYRRAEIAAALYKEVLGLFNGGALTKNRSKLLSEYGGKLLGIGKEVLVQSLNGEYKAVAIGIDDKARLLVNLKDGSIIPLESGEISIKL